MGFVRIDYEDPNDIHVIGIIRLFGLTTFFWGFLCDGFLIVNIIIWGWVKAYF